MKQVIKIGLICIWAFMCNTSLAQLLEKDGLPPVPQNKKLVHDYANMLSSSDVAQIEEALLTFHDSTSNEIAVVTVASLNEEPVEDYAYRLARKWKIGDETKDNGVLILISSGDRKTRIEVGKGLEGAITDLICAEVTREVMRPAFKAGQYGNGIAQAVAILMQASRNEYTPNTDQFVQQGGGSIWPFLILLLVLIVFAIIVFRSRKNGDYYMSRRGHRGWNDPWIGGFPSSGGWLGGGSSGGSIWDGDSGGGHSFGGFGGGDFGGGGASGDW